MSGHLNDLYKLKNGDASRAGEVLADAFQHDPVWNKVFEGIPTARQRFAFETPVRYALKYGKVYAPSENLEGVAAWVSGGVAEMTIWRMIRSGAIRAGIKMGAQLARNMEPVFRPLQRDRQAHMGQTPFIYLQVIGVASAFQGQGLGGKLLRAVIADSEAARVPIYLETETKENVRWYEGYGFNSLQQITLPVFDMPMWEMSREPES